MGIAGGVAALFFSSTVAFAESRPMDTKESMNMTGKNPSGMYRSATTSTTTRQKIGEEARERMETARADAQARMKAQQEKAQQRVMEIRDKAKQQMAERLAKQFDKQNATWTDHFMKLLDRFDAILVKIQERANIAAGNGKDITSTTAAISSAKTTIVTARTAVTTQAAKTYALNPSAIATTTVATTTPSGQEELMRSLRSSFKGLHNTLFKDLFALRDGPMADARRAVQNAIQTLGKIPGVGQGTATTTATTTVTTTATTTATSTNQ